MGGDLRRKYQGTVDLSHEMAYIFDRNQLLGPSGKGIMNKGAKSIVLGFILVSLAAVPVHGQTQEDANENSLGNIARKLNSQKAKDPKPVRVFTNDNLSGFDDAVSVSNPDTKEVKTPSPENPGVKVTTHDESYYRSQMSSLKGKLETHQRELDVLQQKLGQNNMQQYQNDPNKSLQQQYSREDINKLKSDVDAKHLEVDADNKAIGDLRDQLRHEGGDPGWLR